MKMTLRILIVEDSEDDALLVTHQIIKGGYGVEYERVDTAETMKAALREKTWDIILADYKMPHFNGLEALAILQGSGIDIPFIIISGTIGEDAAVEAMKAGAHDYLMKNNLRRLLTAIERELRESKRRAEGRILEQKQKLAEEALRASEERFRLLYENAKIGFYRITPDGTILMANRAFVNMLGYSSFNDLAKRNLKYDGFESPYQRKAFLEKIEQNGEVENFESKWIRRDHTAIFVQESVLAIRDSLGNTLYYDGTAADITQLKLTQDELNWNVALLEARANSSTPNSAIDGILVVDQQGKKIFQNQQAADLLKVPQDIADEKDDERELQWVGNLTKDTEQFIERVKYLYSHPDEISRDVIEYKDGTILDRFTAPVVGKNGEYYGRLWVFRDITERRRTEEALHDSEARYRLLFEVSADGIVIVDVGTKSFKYANPALCRMLGYTEEELRRLGVADIHPQQDLQHVFDEFESLARGDKTLALDIPCLRKDGIIVYADINSTTIIIDGRLSVVGLFRDITERKESEAELQKVHENLKQTLKFNEALLSAIPTPVFYKDKEGRYLGCNRAFSEFMGVTPEEIKGKTVNELWPSEHAKVYHNRDLELMRNPVRQIYEFKVQGKDGLEHPVIYSKDVFRDDNDQVAGIIGAFLDITERKQVEKALRDSEQRYRLLIETANEGILVAQNGLLKFVNPMMQVITGFTKEELLTLPFADFVHPEDKELLIGNHLKRIKGEEVPRYHFRLMKNDKSLRWIEMNGIRIEWEGKPATLNMLTDVTERIQAEEEIFLKNKQLLKLNAEKDKFFSIIAHDLRSPFSSFMGLTEIMVNQLPSLTMDNIQLLAVKLRDSATNLFRLLENLLQWASVQQGLIPVNSKLILLLPIVDESIATVLEPAKNKGIEITYHIPDDLEVFADCNLLQTIIRNLVSNAMKFTPKGGKISISAKTNADKNVEISVKDTGIGMNSAMVDNLFRLDTQTNRMGTDGEPSTGLGLLLCKEFIEKNNGKIWVESEEGKGTTFYFTIPQILTT